MSPLTDTGRSSPHSSTNDVLIAWQSSRRRPSLKKKDLHSAPTHTKNGLARPLTFDNIKIAFFLLSRCWWDVARTALETHPIRAPAMIVLTLFRGVLPAFLMYSRGTTVNELQRLVVSGNDWPSSEVLMSLIQLLFWELCCSTLGRLFETYVDSNSTKVQQSVRITYQRIQLQNQLRLDIPALADPVVQDLFDESNRFVTSLGSGIDTILTPIGLMSLLRDATEFISQAFLLFKIISNPQFRQTHIWLMTLVSLPQANAVLAVVRRWLQSPDDDWPDDAFSQKAVALKRRIAQLENLVHDFSFKSEVVLFGLADWILMEWSKATKEDMELDGFLDHHGVFVASKPSPCESIAKSIRREAVFEIEEFFRRVSMCHSRSRIRRSEVGTLTIHHDFRYQIRCTQVTKVIQYASNSVGTVTVARSAIERMIASYESVKFCIRRSFDSTFDLAAFHCLRNLRPFLDASPHERIPYEISRNDTKRGMKLDIQNLSFTFPNHHVPTLHDINLSVHAGETLAIVGLNGSGKTTLLHVLARMVEFGEGTFEINGVPIRRFNASDLHSRTTAILQSFCRFSSMSVRENIGVGAVSMADGGSRLCEDRQVWDALEASGASDLVRKLGDGLDTPLETTPMGFRSPNAPQYHNHHFPSFLPPPPYASAPNSVLNPTSLKGTNAKGTGLSGGQWQRIAIARALMRKDSYDLMLVDEANSALDQRGQRELFESLVNDPDHGTIIFITHRLEALEYADRVAIMENGRISAIGTREEIDADIKRVFKIGKLFDSNP